MNESKKRQSNIELLRIIAMLGVITLHYIDEPGRVLESLGVWGGKKVYSIVLINSVCVCAVTVFIVHSRFIQIYPILNPNRMELIVLIGNLFIRTIILFAICDFWGLWYAFLEKRMFDFIENKIGFYRLNIGENKTNIGE